MHQHRIIRQPPLDLRLHCGLQAERIGAEGAQHKRGILIGWVRGITERRARRLNNRTGCPTILGNANRYAARAQFLGIACGCRVRADQKGDVRGTHAPLGLAVPVGDLVLRLQDLGDALGNMLVRLGILSYPAASDGVQDLQRRAGHRITGRGQRVVACAKQPCPHGIDELHHRRC